MKIRNCVIFWLSRIVLNLVSLENKSRFRKVENFEKNKINTEIHRDFNQIYLQENLLPKYTNIHTCIYIYIYRCINIYTYIR